VSTAGFGRGPKTAPFAAIRSSPWFIFAMHIVGLLSVDLPGG